MSNNKSDDYIEFGIVFRIDDLDSGVFYIGETTKLDKWNNDYLGTGSSKWENHKKKYPPLSKYPNHPNGHHYKRTILHRTNSRNELYELENMEILQYATWNKDDARYVIADERCKNVRCHKQGKHHSPDEVKPDVCSECGGSKFSHKITCSKSTKKPCEHCGSYTVHRKGCVKHKKNRPCSECGATNHHEKHCSKYRSIQNPCDECGAKRGHRKSCSQYKEHRCCPECGNATNHKKTCSRYKPPKPCEECGSIGPLHRRACSRFKPYGTVCDECGGKGGTHRSTCSKHYRNRQG